MKIKSLYSKIVLPTVLVLLFLVITMTAHSSIQFAEFTNTLFSERIAVTSYGLKDHLSNSEHNSRVAALSISTNINIIHAVRERDKDGILSSLAPLLELYGVNVVTVTDETGTVLARTHADFVGDSVLYQPVVAEALTGMVSTHYQEGTYSSVSIRSGSPVYDTNGTLVGVISAGTRLDDSAAVDDLKMRFDAEFTVFLHDKRVATTIMHNGERIIGTQLDHEIVEIVIEGKEEFSGDVTVLGIDYTAEYLPLFNADNEVFAVIFTGSSNTYLLDKRNDLLFNGILIGFIGLVISVIVLLIVAKRTVKPVNQLKYLVSEVAKGNVNVDFNKKQVSNDEIGTLELDVLSLIDVIRSVESDLSQLIREINTDSDINFKIDANKYSGIHKDIINDIIILGNSISMKNKVMAAMDSLDSIIHVCDLDFNLIYANRSAEKTFSLNPEQYKGVKCYKALRNLDEPCSFCNLPQLVPDKESLPILNYEFLYDDVNDMWFGGRASIIRWTDGSLVFLQTANIETEKKKAQEQLSEAVEIAETASKAKSTFLANMSHEIRTPMNAIIGMAELLQHEKLNKRQREYVYDISTSAHALLSIINDILDLSKIESGKLEISPVNYSFQAFIDNVHSMFNYVASRKNIEFRLESEGEMPTTLYGDDVRLRQVLTNICGNAVKFTDKGYVRLKIAVAGDMLMFEVKDTGSGIRDEDISRLFNAYEQSKTDKNRNITGTGLGLAISKVFVEMMGGSIMLESEFGQGTIITIMVPLIPGNETDVSPEKVNVKKEHISAPSARILVVDDNDYNLKVAQGLLNLLDIDAKIAFSGKEAIELVNANEFDIVFMDHMMPEMDGVETVEVIRKLGEPYNNLTIIALTANAVHGAKEMFLANGFNGFIAKPIELQELVELIIEWLPKEKVIYKSKEAYAASTLDDESQSDFLDAVSNIGEINTEIGLSRASGVESIYRSNLTLFCKKLPTECKKMSASLNDEDIKNFSISVHSMKSMLSSVGAMDLSKEALALETASKNIDIKICREQYPAFEEKLLSVYSKLTILFPEKAVILKNVSGDPVYLMNTLKKALIAADDCNKNTGLTALKELNIYDFGEQYNILLENINAAFVAYDFEKAAEIINKIVNQ